MPELLQHWLTQAAERRPDAVAIVHGAERVTYAQLEEASNRLASVLVKRGCRRHDRVALLMPKSPLAIAAMLGVLKADAIYVPLDAANPPARLQSMLAACDTPWLLAAGGVAGALRQLVAADLPHALSIGWLDTPGRLDPDWPTAFSLDDLDDQPGTPRDCDSRGDDPAHILFTSGSAGVPKGVVIRHASVVRFVEWATRYFGLTADDRTSGHAPLHFDLSTFDVYGTLAAGACLHLVPPELNVMPARLADFIRDAALTQWFSVPAVLGYLASFDALAAGDFPALRRVLWCGEVLPTPALMYWMRRLPHVQFTNLYGPTEATIASSYYTVPRCPDDPAAAIPIGRACDGETLRVLDAWRQDVAPGESGELYIGGAGLSAGYWRDPERTAEAFVAGPDGERLYRTGDLARVDGDGLVYFLGRADSQVKSRGYRIELGEIETALHTLEGVHEAAVVALPTTGFEGTQLCCAYVPRAHRVVVPSALRKALATRLPAYMLPTRWLALAALPRTANGKIDRRHLRDRFHADAPGSDRA